jgi:hypothetical protein
MTGGGNGGKDAPKDEGESRHLFGPRAVGALVPGLVRPAFRKRAPATAQVLADWEAIMGPAIAAVTAPRKLFSGSLVIACSGPMALELQHLAPQLMARINGHLGRVAVTRLRFVQDAPAAVARPKRPRPAAVAQARAAVAGLPEGDLRDALEALGRAVLAGR